jgi:DNA-binding winged helix-turn-helix (wHTH) protein/tetratricopeptide (TPR) repeat protein
MSGTTYRFAGVELDTARRQIRVGDRHREVSPQVFDTLEFLARHAKQVVSRDDLADALWEGRIVTEASVTQAIRKARAALQACGVDASIVRTLHGHGYRLDADVEIGGADPAEAMTAGPEARESRGPEWQKHPFRTGAIAAVLGGILVTAANISEILSWLYPDESVELLEETQLTIESTDAKVDELVRLLRDQAALSGRGLDPASEDTIREAVTAIVSSVDTRKQHALDLLVEGDADAAAASIVAVAEDLDEASSQSVDAAAASWREAGAIYYTNNIDQAVRSYEAAYRLRPDDPVNPLDLAFTYVRAGRLDDALTLFDALAARQLPPDMRSDALRGAGIVRRLQGEYDSARRTLEESLSIAGENGDIRRKGLVLLQLGAIARAQGENDVARAQFETAVGYAEEIADQHLLAESLNNLGIVMSVTEEFDAADEVLMRVQDIHTARSDLAGRATAIGNLGANALGRGDTDQAEEYLLESVALGERLGWQRSIALDLINLATIAAAREQFDLAKQRLSRALDIATAMRLAELHPIILVNLGEVARDRGDEIEACRYWQDALPLLEAMEHSATTIVADYRDSLGCL